MNKFNTWAEEIAVRLQESIPEKRLSIPLPFCSPCGYYCFYTSTGEISAI